MQGKEWIYYFVDQQGRTYQYENGILVAKHNAKPIVFSPDGWQDISIGWERDLTTWGINRNFGLPFGFVMDGLDMLQQIFLTKTVDEVVYLLIKRQQLFISDTEYYFWYKYFSKTEIDLSEGVLEESRFEAPLMEGGLIKDYQANKDTTYEIGFDQLDYVRVKMDGVDLKQSAKFVVTNGLQLANNGNHSVEMQLVNQEGINLNIKSVSRFNLGTTNQNLEMVNKDAWFYKPSSANPLKIAWRFSVTTTLASGISPNPAVQLFFVIRYIRRTDGIAIKAVTLNQFNGPSQVYRENLFEGEATLDMSGIDNPAEIDLYPFLGINLVGPSADQAVFHSYGEDGIFEITEAVYRHPTTYVRAFTWQSVFYELVKRITGQNAKALSMLLGLKWNFLLVPGDELRGIEGAKLKTNLSDLFKAADSLWCAGLSVVNGLLRLEAREFFFDSSNPIHLGKVKNVKVKWAKNLMFNRIKVGYNDQTYDEVNGRDVFNTQHEYGTSVKKVVRELDLICPYRADHIGAELMRINLDGKKTTDSSSDNDVFILGVNDYDSGDGFFTEDNKPVYTLRRPAYQTIEGIVSPETAFNIEGLTPKRMLDAHKRWIASMLYGYAGTSLTFQTAKKNASLRTVLNGVEFDEDGDVPVEALGPGFAKPRLIEFEPDGATDLVELLEENPNRCFSFEHPNGEIFTGYNLKIGIQPDSKEAQAFQLLSTYDNDLTKLKNG